MGRFMANTVYMYSIRVGSWERIGNVTVTAICPESYGGVVVHATLIIQQTSKMKGAIMSMSLFADVWTDLVGKSFVLGAPNAKGEFIITLGGTRWLIANPQQLPAGERVRVESQEGEMLVVARA